MNYKDLIEEGITMVLPHCFETVIRHQNTIADLKGDIVECGVWKGGFSIFLADTFKEKNIWVADSFEGFQPLSESKYEYENDRHNPGYSSTIKVSLEEVQSNFKRYNLEGDRIKFLKGFVKDTLPTSGIQKIALLRVDVDAYSATLEVLDELYDKVVSGGYIIFDDACLYESLNAIRTFFKKRNIDPYLIDPFNDQVLPLTLEFTSDDSEYPTGCYIIKQ